MADIQEADAEDLLQAAPETTSLDTASDVENEVGEAKPGFYSSSDTSAWLSAVFFLVSHVVANACVLCEKIGMLLCFVL
jgi:hypothetical protein